MRTKAPASLPIFRSDLQARLLALLTLNPELWWTTAELRRRLGASQAGLSIELRRLSDAGLLEREQIGRAHRHRIATDSPLYEPLRLLIERSLGVEAKLGRCLDALPGLVAAGIFGSWAAGRAGPTSDIDVIAVGDFDQGLLAAEIREIERIAGREISVIAYRPDELHKRIKGGSGFLRSVAQGPIKPLVGDIAAMVQS